MYAYIVMKLHFSFATTLALCLNRISAPHDIKYETVARVLWIDTWIETNTLNILLFKKKTNEDISLLNVKLKNENFYYLPDHYLFNIHFFDDNKISKKNLTSKKMVLIKDALERIIWHDLKIGGKKLLIIDRKGNIFHRGDIYHAKLDMPRNQMVSVPRTTPVLFKVLRLVWANVHEQPRIRLQTFFISNTCWQIKKRTMKRAQCKITFPRAFPFLIWYFVKEEKACI